VRKSSEQSGTGPSYAADPHVGAQSIWDPQHLELDFIALLLVLVRKKNRILQVTLAAMIVGAIVALILPKTFTATATILVPQRNQSVLGAILGQVGVISGIGETDLGLTNPSDLFVAMLRSRTVEDDLINRFNLRQVYQVQRYQDARRKLENRSEINGEREGLISIAVSDRDPKRAAELANGYVKELSSLNQDLALSEASQRRRFYQQRRDQESGDLLQAEMAMKQVQEKTGLIQLDAQNRAIIEALATARAHAAASEVQLRAMRTYATANNPDVKRAEQELEGFRSQITKLEQDSGETGNGNLQIPTRRLPQVQAEYISRARDLKYHEALYEFLGKQLEAARIDEARNAVLVQVVDKAVEPERKSGPHVLLIILLSAATMFVLSCLGLLIQEAWRRRQLDPDEAARINLLRNSLRFSSWRS